MLFDVPFIQELIEGLLSTGSPAKRIEKLKEVLHEHSIDPEIALETDLKDIHAFLQEEVNKKAQQGHEGGAARRKQKRNRMSHVKGDQQSEGPPQPKLAKPSPIFYPMGVNDYSTDQCVACGQHPQCGKFVWRRTEGGKCEIWCHEPGCFPPECRELFESNPVYRKVFLLDTI